MWLCRLAEPRSIRQAGDKAISGVPSVQEALLDCQILLVDDNAVNLALLETLLGSEGYGNVKAISDSREIHTVFPAQSFDLLILDVQMPHLDGFEVMREVRAMEASLEEDQRVPILILTAQTDRAVKIRAFEEGAFDFITKPIDTHEVAYRIRNALTQRILLQRLRRQLDG